MADSDAADIRQSAEALYAEGQEIWDRKDQWNFHKRAGIEAFVVGHCLEVLDRSDLVLNAGSGGEPYSWLPQNTINSDLFLEQVRRLPKAVVSDVCSLPFPNATFDFSVCVGSVLNYAPLLESLSELARSLKIGGHLLIHFESSNSFEQWLSPNRNKSVVRITTINSGKIDKIWIYSPGFVAEALQSFGLEIRKMGSFHIASAFASRLGASQEKAAKLGRLDRWLSFLASAADDQIILAEKVS